MGNSGDFKRISEGATEGMIRLNGGSFLMGTNDADGFFADGEGPVREIHLDSFFLDEACVTNAKFARFVDETSHVTDAGTFGYSYVFHLFLEPGLKAELTHLGRQLMGVPWWYHVEGADWDCPEGPGSNLSGRMEHPVVHISYRDAAAYCEWAGKRLPTEAEFEYAARGGLVQKKYQWGDDLTPGGKHMCNIWQGRFPFENSMEDGFAGTAPVKSFEPNGYGFYNMTGNVWEWVYDWWSPDFHVNGPRQNPVGPPSGDRRVTRGGSYLCHHSYCNRYRVAARTSNTPDSSTGNTGFRCALDI